MVGALSFFQYGPDLTSARCHKSFTFKLVFVGSRLVPRVFLVPQKLTYPDSNSTRIEDPPENQLRLHDVASSPNIVINLLFILCKVRFQER